MPRHWGGEYVTRLWDMGPNSDFYMPGVDAETMGNELRMINDFRGVPGATGPNCRFSRAAIRGFRAALIVAIKPIAPNEELLLDYGEVYWRPELADEEERRPESPKVDSECECACLARCARRAQSALRTATPFSNRGCLETIQGSTFVSASTSPRTHAWSGLETVTKALACVEWVCLRLPKRRVYQDLRFTAFVLNPTEWGSTSAPPPSGSLVVYSF